MSVSPATLVAHEKMWNRSPPADAPMRLRPLLKQYDLVLEVLAPTVGPPRTKIETPKAVEAASRGDWTGKMQEALKKKPVEVEASASWVGPCGDPDHRIVSFSPLTLDGETIEDPKIKAQLHCRSWLDVLRDPTLAWTDLFSHSAYEARYAMDACSCGLPTEGPAVTSLNALVLAQPADSWGLSLAINLVPFSFGYTPEAKRESETKRREQMEALEKKLRSRKRNQKHRDQAQGQLQALQAKDQSPVTALTDPASAEATPWVQWSVTINDRDFGFDELKAAYGAAKSLYDFATSAQAQWETLEKVYDFIIDYSPSLVQPKLGGEIKFCTLTVSADTRYDTSKSGPRFVSLARHFDLDAEFVFLEATGVFGVVVGKQILGTGASVTALVTLAGSIGGSLSYVLKGADLTSEEKKALFVQGLKIEGKITGTASAAINAQFLYLDLASKSASLSCGITAENEPYNPADGALAVKVNRTELVLTYESYFCWLPSAEPERVVLIKDAPLADFKISFSGAAE